MEAHPPRQNTDEAHNHGCAVVVSRVAASSEVCLALPQHRAMAVSARQERMSREWSGHQAEKEAQEADEMSYHCVSGMKGWTCEKRFDCQRGCHLCPGWSEDEAGREGGETAQRTRTTSTLTRTRSLAHCGESDIRSFVLADGRPLSTFCPASRWRMRSAARHQATRSNESMRSARNRNDKDTRRATAPNKTATVLSRGSFPVQHLRWKTRSG